MTDKLFKARLSFFVVLALLVAMIWWYEITEQTSLENEYLEVTFLDVGQGDAIFIETADGVQILIDGGPDNKVLRELATVMPLFDKTIDFVIATHLDKDHIGGLIDVFERYHVPNILMTENQNQTVPAISFLEKVEVEKTKIYLARAGQEFSLGASTTLMVYSPHADTTNYESNNSSVVVQLRYGNIEFFLTGDASIGVEEFLANRYGTSLQSEVLKLGHHGSRTSSSEVFLDTVLPEYAVVSSGIQNTYGHPHPEVVENVTERGVRLLNTAVSGQVRFITDGRDLWLEEG